MTVLAEAGEEGGCNSTSLPEEQQSSGAPGDAVWQRIPTKEEEQASHLDDLRHQSSEKLRRAWDSIYTRFQDAHLQVQDEIYLGRHSVKGDRMRVLRDRGHLRALPNATLPFGSIYLDKAELIGFGAVQEGQRELKDESDSAEGKVKEEDEEEGDATNTSKPMPKEARIDPYLQEFLEAEEQRKRLCGGTDDDDESDECDIVEGKADVFDGDAVLTSRQSGRGKRRVGVKRIDEDSRRLDSRDSETEEEEDDDIEVYSLAKGPLLGTHESSSSSSSTCSNGRSSPSALSRSPSEEQSDCSLTPPTSTSSTPNIHKTKGGDRSMAAPIGITPDRTLTAQKRALHPMRSSSTSKKRKQGSIVLPRWDAASPKAKLKKEEDACSGESRCTKSMCMICGGFRRRAAEETEEE